MSKTSAYYLAFFLGSALRLLYGLIGLFTAMVGYEIHHNLFFSFVNFIFWPISLAVWLIIHDLNISVIKHTFSFFFS